MDITYSSTLAFMRLAAQQIRLVDNATADLLEGYHVEEVTRIFQVAANRRQVTSLDQSQRDAEGRFASRAINLLDAVKQLLPAAPPGLGSLPEVPKQNDGDSHYKRPRGLSDSCSDTPPPSDTFGARFNPMDQTSMKFIEGPQRRVTQYGAIGDRSSLSPPELARRSLFENSQPESPSTSRAPSGTVGSPRPITNRTVTGDSAQGVPTITSSISTDSLSSGVALTHLRENTIRGSVIPGTNRNSLPAEQPGITTWAKIATIAKPQGAVPTVDEKPEPSHFDGHWTEKLSQTQAALNPTSRLDQALRKESRDDTLRVVWITKLPTNYNLYRLGVHLNRGPIMSLLIGRNLDPALPGHSVCIIFRCASEAREFCVDNHYIANQKLHDGGQLDYNPLTDVCAASLLTDAPGALVLPLARYSLDDDLLSMDGPVFCRRRIKWSRARLFHDVDMTAFKRDVFSICGRSNVEFFHFYNPGEATAVFSSVKVAAVVKAWFNARRIRPGARPRASAAKAWDSRYEGVDVSFCKGFEEARPDKLISSYARNGNVRRVTEEKGLEGLYMGPPVVGGVNRVT